MRELAMNHPKSFLKQWIAMLEASTKQIRCNVKHPVNEDGTFSNTAHKEIESVLETLKKIGPEAEKIAKTVTQDLLANDACLAVSQQYDRNLFSKMVNRKYEREY